MHRITELLLFLLLLAIGLGSTPWAYAKLNYEYQVRINPEQIEKAFSIVAVFQGLEGQEGLKGLDAKKTVFTVTRSFGTVVDLKLVKNLKAFDGTGSPLEIQQDSEGNWILNTQTKTIKLQYNIDMNPKTHRVSIQQPGGLAIPNFFENGITFRPGFCFVRPKDLDLTPEIQVRFEKPEGWEIASSWSDLSKVQNFSHFLGSYFLAHRKNGFIKVSDETIELYWARNTQARNTQNDETPTPEYLSKVLSTFKTQLAFFKTRKQDGKYLGIVTPAAASGGEAGFRGLLVTYNTNYNASPNSMSATHGGSSNQTAWIAQTLSHEFFHFWESESAYHDKNNVFSKSPKNRSEEGGDFRWFTEGFTDYFSYYFLVKADLLSASEFADILEHKSEATLFSTPRKKLSLIQASHNFFIGQKSRELSYSLGALVALKLDFLLKSDTDGKKSLLGFLSFFLNDSNMKKSINNYKIFRKSLEAYHPGTAKQIAPYIEDIKTVELSQIFEAFGGKNTPTFRYMLGSNTTEQEAPICLVNPPERLIKFGLRDGDCITEIGSKKVTSRQQLYEYKDRPVPITIRRKDAILGLKVNLIKKSDSHWSFDNSKQLKLFEP